MSSLQPVHIRSHWVSTRRPTDVLISLGAYQILTEMRRGPLPLYGHCGIALVESGNCHSGYDRSLRDAETGALTSLTSTAGTHPVNYQNMSLNTQDRRRPRHPPAHASHFFPFFFPFPGALLLLFDSLMLNPPLINASRPTALIIRNRSGPR